MSRSFLYGLILNLQFFTTIPIKNIEVPIQANYLRRTVQLFPLLGLLQGIIYSFVAFVLHTWTPLSSLAMTLILWLLPLLITGAIHLDGWIDSSDAYFSYRDRKRRIEILADPTIGAFGLISAICLLTIRFVVLYEIFTLATAMTFLLFILVPFLGKISMSLFITFIKPAKQEGLGYLFYKASNRKVLLSNSFFLLIIYTILFLLDVDLVLIGIILLTVMFISYLYIKRKIKTAFGGMNGDLVGGATEGVETVLWLVIWLYHYYAMV